MTVVDFAAKKPRPRLPELGTPGTQFLFGFLQTDEYVPELLGTRGLKTFEKMRRSDGMIAAALAALKLPLLSAPWAIAPASEDARDIAIAERLEEDLFRGMSMSWLDHLRQVLTHLDLGFYLCEVVWAIADDGHVKIRKLAPRLQRTIVDWQIQDDGGLKGVKQAVYSSKGYRTQEIPIDKLLIFTNEKEGANWAGKSVLRPAYKHWYIKDQLYRIDSIAAERHGVGIPYIELPEDTDDPLSLQRAEDIGASVGAHEKGYVVMPHGWVFDIKGMGGGRAVNLMPMIQHHDRMIAVSVLAPQLTLGERPEGSFALSEDQSSFFMMVQRARADYICDIHDRYLIPKWVNFNYAGVTKYPRLTVGKIETRNVEKIINAISTAVQAGAMTADLTLENTVRRLTDVPLLEEQPEPEPEPVPVPPVPSTPATDATEDAFRAEVRHELAALRAQRPDVRDDERNDERIDTLYAALRVLGEHQAEARHDMAESVSRLAVAIAQREERPIEVNVTPAPIEVNLTPAPPPAPPPPVIRTEMEVVRDEKGRVLRSVTVARSTQPDSVIRTQMEVERDARGRVLRSVKVAIPEENVNG